MKKNVLITGANSFIAKYIISLISNKYTIKLLTRNPSTENEYKWDISNQYIDEKALENVDYIIHLAGSKLNDGTPLTEERKKLVYESRIGAANLILEKLKENNQKIKGFISASAIGYYGFQDNTLEIDETGKKGIGFAAELSDDWEKAADLFKEEGIAEHVSKIRVSLVLGKEAGIFPIYKSLVQRNPEVVNQNNLSSVPWNHVEDMAGIFVHAMENHLDGIYNSVAPYPASQQDIYKAISNEMGLHKYQLIEPYKGQHLVAKKIQEKGFQFKYPTIEEAVKAIFS
ncbi:DUF1731 domain-containing protein [Faecalibacter rhinopitheci]|uniref:DUF1731 domain-containing protein n=1 Tax=Faecalibacter rhinopitheci TaxID=2779678 RepID=A0A8J7FRE2_9FLAO|nr:DUF1731 domain-containing protein [Faecalibacter rhinopitheci]MBF0596142.1 DUF1731 domain-containing protein [Faecalibacter rhinopitheci]